MRKLKFDVIFWDGKDPDTIEHWSLEKAFGDGLVYFKDGDITPVDECAIVRQFTGLHDSNGVEIYEGDIVKCNNDHVGVIEWEKNDCCFNVTEYYSTSDDYPTMAFMEGQPFEVIGNIREQ